MTTTLRPTEPLQRHPDGTRSRRYQVCVNGRPVGVLLLGTHPVFGEGVARVTELRIEEADRRRGRATVAALAAEEVARGWGCTRIEVTVPGDAVPALRLVTALGYLEGDTVTERGSHLRRIYTDMDLVAAEAIRSGLFDELAPSELAAVLSALVFEARRADDASSPKMPGGQVRPALAEVVRLWGALDALERDHKLDFLREPDVGFAWAAWRWAEGDDLDDVLMVTGLSAGDFVRWMKQLLDLCGQVADAAGDSELRTTARATAKLLKRGVIAYSVLAE